MLCIKLNKKFILVKIYQYTCIDKLASLTYIPARYDNLNNG